MLTLYYAPGACSMASHIALEETGAPYKTQVVALAQGEQTKPEYLNSVNSRGKVPALKTDDGILTENVAILTYLARDVLGQDAVIGLQRRHLAAGINAVQVFGLGLLALRQRDDLRLIGRAGFLERDVRGHRTGAGGVVERQ